MVNFRGQHGRILDTEVEVGEIVRGCSFHLLVEIRMQVMARVLGICLQ